MQRWRLRPATSPDQRERIRRSAGVIAQRCIQIGAPDRDQYFINFLQSRRVPLRLDRCILIRKQRQDVYIAPQPPSTCRFQSGFNGQIAV